MRKLEKTAVLMAVLLATSACNGGNDDDAGGGPSGSDGGTGLPRLETPTFSEVEDAASGETAEATPPTAEGTHPTAATSGGSATTTMSVAAGTESVSFDDPIGDATPGVGAGAPPSWTDLAGGSLERQGNAYRLTVRLGGEAPQTAPSRETMNIASFYDVDGDGAVEYEIWVNLGRDGWGPVWYDDEGNAAPGERSNVTVVVDGDEIRLLFPDVMLGAPDRLRFSIASEYGELSSIGSSSARRDDAPDNDQAVSFP